MMNKKILFIAMFIFAFGLSTTYAQQNKIGGSLLYNLSNKGIGIGFRTEFPIQQINLLEGITVVPQIAYYPSFNDIHEFYIGSSVHVNGYAYDKWTFYGLMNISYNGWINNDSTQYRSGNFSNLGIDLGIGVNRKLMKCLYPFFEFRYNFIWNDPVIHLGMMYTLRCDRRGQVPCSKVKPPPTFE